MPKPPEDLQGKSAPQSQRSYDRTKPRAENGSYIFTVKSIRDLGYVESKFHQDVEEGSGGKPMLRVVVEGAQPGGDAFVLSRDITHSYDKRSILCLLAVAILGVDLKDEDVVIDYRQLPRGQFLGQVKSRKYHPKGDDGNPQEDVDNYFTEWFGEPMALPAGVAGAPAPAREAADPGPDRVSEPVEPGAEIAIAGSTITKAVWDDVGPLLREMLDKYFNGRPHEMRTYLVGKGEAEFTGDLQGHAEAITSWMHERGGGPQDVVFNFRDRSNADAEDLGLALKQFLAMWGNEAVDAPGDDADPDDLPF